MAVKRILCACLALLAASCASGPKPDELFMSQLLATLGGSYDNLAQSRGSPDHSPLKLMIAPVQAPLVGEHVFYVQEVAADNAQRVLAQRLYVVSAVPDKQMAVLTQADLAEPLRWRDGHLKRNLFSSMLTQDAHVMPVILKNEVLLLPLSLSTLGSSATIRTPAPVSFCLPLSSRCLLTCC